MFEPRNLQPMSPANDLLKDAAALHATFQEDGFIFIRGLIASDTLIALREDITRILAEHGWISDGIHRSNARAIGIPYREGESEYIDVYEKIQKLEGFHALAHEPALMSVIHALLGEGAFPHPLSIARLVFPNNIEATTPPHQDFPNNQGSRLLTAAWMPLSDCPKALGPLAVLKGSHRLGLLPLTGSLGPGNRRAVLPDSDHSLTWVASDFHLGDVVFFPAMTVHAALPNQHSDQMRLSVDYRFQPAGAALTEQCLYPHFQTLTWEDIYHNWKRDDLKYYWRRHSYEITPFDNKIHDISAEEETEVIGEGIRYEHRRMKRHQVRQTALKDMRRS